MSKKRGRLELDLYHVTRWRLDLDGDGDTGEAEVNDNDTIAQLPEREVIRVVPVHQASAPRTCYTAAGWPGTGCGEDSGLLHRRGLSGVGSLYVEGARLDSPRVGNGA